MLSKFCKRDRDLLTKETKKIMFKVWVGGGGELC